MLHAIPEDSPGRARSVDDDTQAHSFRTLLKQLSAIARRNFGLVHTNYAK